RPDAGDTPVTIGSDSFACINPAAKAFRDELISSLRPAIESLHPDAIHLAGSGNIINDGIGTVEEKTFAEGMVAMHRALLTAFPGLVLSTDGISEMIAPFNWLAQRTGIGVLAPHPI